MIDLQVEWQDAAAWDRFVDSHPQARYCHAWGYRHVAGCYGYRPRALAFLRNGTLVGVLPAVEVASLLYGRRLMSQPFSEYGGILFEPDLSHDETEAALNCLHDFLARNPSFTGLELHGNHGVAPLPAGLAVAEPVGHIAVMSLTSDTTSLWNDTVRYSVRKAVKQAQGYGVTVTFNRDTTVLARSFFPLYLKSMKRLGVPPHKLAYYTRSLEAFCEKMILATARAENGEAIAALLGFSCGGRINIINTVSNPAFWNLKANDLLHWEMIKHAAETGHRFFDFGSVRYDGQQTYKKKWGTEFFDHSNYLLTADASRRVMINSSSNAMKRLAGLWSAYVPEAFGRHIGPLIRGQLAR